MANFYSECQTLAVNCRLCSDAGLLYPIISGFVSNGDNCYETDETGKIAAITTCTIPCDLVMGNIVVTDPTTLGGTDGTATVNYTTSHGPSTYTLNGGAPLPAANPLVITGLSALTDYVIIITDSNTCTSQATVRTGQSATAFDADWIMVTYEFQSPGRDLDTRTRIALPNIGQDAHSEYLGYGCSAAYPVTGTPILTWSNDNTGTGFESVLINIAQFKALFPSATEFTADLRAFWWVTPTTNPVVCAVTLWKGGTPVKSGFVWTNPTAQFEGTIDSVPKVINLNIQNASTNGERVATLRYRLDTLVAILNNADTTTPVLA